MKNMMKPNMLEVLKARAKENRTTPVMSKNQLIERLKARAKAEDKEIKTMPITTERIKALIERSKKRINKQEE